LNAMMDESNKQTAASAQATEEAAQLGAQGSANGGSHAGTDGEMGSTGDAAATPEAVEAETVDYTVIIGRLEAALAEEKARADKLVDQAQRMAAEYQNSRRRQEAQLGEEIDRAAAHLVKRLLPVIDDFDLAFAHVPADLQQGAAWVEGFRQIQKKLHSVLAEEGVTPIAGEGEFDPSLHEAVSGEASETVPSGHVIATLRTGYTYKGKVLRPALVRVAT
jgi:molecular chaperone GrpE